MKGLWYGLASFLSGLGWTGIGIAYAMTSTAAFLGNRLWNRVRFESLEAAAQTAERRITGDGCDACRAAALIASDIRQMKSTGAAGSGKING